MFGFGKVQTRKITQLGQSIMLLETTCEQDERLHNLFCVVKAFPTTQFYTWRALRDKLPTYENLVNRGIVLNGISWACVIHTLNN